MTNRSIKAALVGAALLGGFAASSAQAATATATARAKILKNITLAKTADLDFGTIIVGTAGDTVVVSPAGVRTCAVVTCTGTPTAAAFTISGTTGETVTIAATGSATLTSGTNSMAISSYTTSAATRVLTGTDSFSVGASLAVGANQADGVYTGSVNVTVNYQ
jgi:Mat/Ecp fimbriae major subunit